MNNFKVLFFILFGITAQAQLVTGEPAGIPEPAKIYTQLLGKTQLLRALTGSLPELLDILILMWKMP